MKNGRRSSRLKGKRYRLARQRTLELHEARTGKPWSDRYVVSSVSGWPINQRAAASARGPTTVWYVHDEAYCGRVVAAFRSTAGDNGALLANRYARLLNKRDWQADHD